MTILAPEVKGLANVRLPGMANAPDRDPGPPPEVGGPDTMPPRPSRPVEDVEIMPETADRILAELAALRGQLDRLETRIERVEVLGAKVAVLERQDANDQASTAALDRRVQALEASQRTVIRLEALESQVHANRDAVARLSETVAGKAGTETLAAEATRITALETAGHRQEGMSKALVVGWTLVTAAPGLAGLALTLWRMIGDG